MAHRELREQPRHLFESCLRKVRPVSLVPAHEDALEDLNKLGGTLL